MKKFEYRFVKVKYASFGGLVEEENEATLIGLGLQGWQLSTTANHGGTMTHFIMERQVSGMSESEPGIDELV